jgi:hypothetical protein
MKILDDSKQKMLGPAGTTSSLLINGNGSPAMERRTYNQPGEENKHKTIVVVSSPKGMQVSSNSKNLFHSRKIWGENKQKNY